MKNSAAKLPPAPKHVSAEVKGWWRKIVATWELDDASLLVLEGACECFDRMRQAQAVIAKEGIVIRDRFEQLKPHPATVVERDAKAGLLRHLKALNLDIEPLNAAPGRPCGTPSFARKDYRDADQQT